MLFKQIKWESENPTDAHKRLPYYTTLGRAKRVKYSRVAPIGVNLKVQWGLGRPQGERPSHTTTTGVA